MSVRVSKNNDPTSPKNVAADALVSIILLTATTIAEIIKRHIPGGVPLVVSAILGISEITMLIYFGVALVRACGYALVVIDNVYSSVKNTRSWQVSKQSYQVIIGYLKNALPTIFEIRHALWMLVKYLLITLGAVIIFVLLISIMPPMALRDPDVYVPIWDYPTLQPSQLLSTFIWLLASFNAYNQEILWIGSIIVLGIVIVFLLSQAMRSFSRID